MQYNQFKLKDLLEIKNGTDYRKIEKGSIPVYGSGGYMTSINKWLYDGESILLPRKGTINNIMFVNGKFWTVDTMYWSIINKQKVVPYYLYNYLKALNFNNLYTGSTLPSMTNSAYYSIPVNLPSFDNQKKLAHILKIIDKKIELNNKINQELETVAKTLYNYWFIQFDFPDENERPYKSSGGAMVYNEILKREIPINFEIKYVKDFLDVVTGKEDANFSDEKGQYAFFTCGDEILKCNQPVFKGKSILIAGNGNFNIKYFEGKFNAYQRTYVLIPNDDLFVGTIYLSALNRINAFTKGSSGSIVKFITKRDVENIPVIVPKNRTLLRFFNKLLDKQNHIRYENQQLVKLRDFLLPMLMNGQISIIAE